MVYEAENQNSGKVSDDEPDTERKGVPQTLVIKFDEFRVLPKLALREPEEGSVTKDAMQHM